MYGGNTSGASDTKRGAWANIARRAVQDLARAAGVCSTSKWCIPLALASVNVRGCTLIASAHHAYKGAFQLENNNFVFSYLQVIPETDCTDTLKHCWRIISCSFVVHNYLLRTLSNYTVVSMGTPSHVLVFCCDSVALDYTM